LLLKHSIVISIAVIVETLTGTRIAAYSADYAKSVEPKTPAIQSV